MAAVTKDTLESASYSNILSIVDTRSNISDPRDKSGKKGRRFVYDADPFHLAINFDIMPYIIVELPTLSYSRQSEDGKTKEVQWKFSITLRTARDGSANTRIDSGRTDMLSMCDALTATFNSATIRQQLSLLRMSFVDLKKVRTDTITVDQKYCYESQYELTTVQRIQVSS